MGKRVNSHFVLRLVATYKSDVHRFCVIRIVECYNARASQNGDTPYLHMKTIIQSVQNAPRSPKH